MMGEMLFYTGRVSGPSKEWGRMKVDGGRASSVKRAR